ncbi:MAG: flavodoxin family protein [Candidatus Latescibacterota bacterium]
MHVIAFSASPRKAGNSESLLDRVIEGLRCGDASVEKIRTHDLDIFPCAGCGGCERDGECVIDDGFRGVREKLVSCDGVIFASPLYFMNVPARGKALIDRCQSFWVIRRRLGIDLFGGRDRFGLLVACSGAGRGPGGADVFRGIEDTMTFFFDALGLKMLESLLVRKVDAPGAILKMPDILDRAKERGLQLAKYP